MTFFVSVLPMSIASSYHHIDFFPDFFFHSVGSLSGTLKPVFASHYGRWSGWVLLLPTLSHLRADLCWRLTNQMLSSRALNFDQRMKGTGIIWRSCESMATSAIKLLLSSLFQCCFRFYQFPKNKLLLQFVSINCYYTYFSYWS